MKNYSFKTVTDYGYLPDADCYSYNLKNVEGLTYITLSYKTYYNYNTYYAWRNNYGFSRINGPARLIINSYEEWWLDGKFHRLDGPAFISYPKKICSFHILGEPISVEDYLNHSDVDINFKLYYINNLDEFK